MLAVLWALNPIFWILWIIWVVFGFGGGGGNLAGFLTPGVF